MRLVDEDRRLLTADPRLVVEGVRGVVGRLSNAPRPGVQGLVCSFAMLLVIICSISSISSGVLVSIPLGRTAICSPW